jgi:Replication-relaxation
VRVMLDTDSMGRRSRLRPTSTGKRVSPTERDILWFQKLAEHGSLPTSFLLEFCNGSHASEKRASERLCDLFHEDNTPDGGAYLVRPPQQFRTIDSRYNQLVYDLAPAGWRALERSGVDIAQYSSPSGPWLHRFMTACITASIELACLSRDDISYIPQSEMLQRARTTLCCPVIITEPATKRQMTKDLIPDALFGLRYRTADGDRFRFFTVEADRATEPTTSANWNRKSFLRNLLQYNAYVSRGAYRQHLNLTAPLLVLNVLSDQRRMERMAECVAKSYPSGNSFMLFQAWEDFGPAFRPPHPRSSLLMGDWVRGGLSVLSIQTARPSIERIAKQKRYMPG